MHGSRRVGLRDGKALAYSMVGSGPPVLLLHGFTGSRDSWDAASVRALSARHTVMALDLLGHGDSSPCVRSERYAMSEIVADVGEALAFLASGSVDVIGYSMGARVALAAAIHLPDKVGRLVLESGSPGLADPGARRARRVADERLARRLEVDGLAPFLEHWQSLPLFRGSEERLSRSRLRELKRQRGRNDPMVLAAVLRGLGTGSQPSYWDRLPSVVCPSLILVGGEDAKFVDIGRRMSAAISGGELSVVAGAGHRVHVERPREWVEAIGRFLQ